MCLIWPIIQIPYVVDRIRDLSRSSRPDLLSSRYIPTSYQSRQLILAAGLPLADLDICPRLDVAFDGADECDLALNCIKGGGGAHLQEKVVASCASQFIVVADHRKDSKDLGEKWDKGVPLEVLPMACSPIRNRLLQMGAVRADIRMGVNKAGPVITDAGNMIVDAVFRDIPSPERLDSDLHRIPGILETGLFIRMVDIAYFGQSDGTVVKRRRRDSEHSDCSAEIRS
uniref:ribose-5-phosphate isomerase n=1 Tax=Spongospora subterranea TaxID=70186 RepID=A0A0H5QJC3_9EUKA|eukprot:CRZ01401.1 hypothetical protein [Spongospora subterranea]